MFFQYIFAVNFIVFVLPTWLVYRPNARYGWQIRYVTTKNISLKNFNRFEINVEIYFDSYSSFEQHFDVFGEARRNYYRLITDMLFCTQIYMIYHNFS
jgi:hypothetical protein